MVSLLSVLLVLALVAIVMVLLAGVYTFVRGGQANERWAGRLMNLRVATQAIAVLILGLIIFLRHS